MDCQSHYCRMAYINSGILGYSCGFPIAFIGLVLNVITIIVILKQKSIRKHPLVPLIFYMTLSDLVICLYGIPMKSLQFYLNYWPFAKMPQKMSKDNDFICKLTFPLFALPWLVSLILLSLVSVNRGLSLLYGKDFALRKFNWKNTSIIFLIVSTSWCFFKQKRIPALYIFAFQVILFGCIIFIFPLTENWGKIEHHEYFQGIYGCKLTKADQNEKIGIYELIIGLTVLLTWIVSLIIYLYIRQGTKKNLEDAEIYIRRVEAVDSSATEHIRYHKKEVEIEKSSYQVLKCLIICYTIFRLPRKHFTVTNSKHNQ